MYVMAGHQVQEVDDQDIYDKEQNLERKIIHGQDVMNYMQVMEQRHPECVIFMIDLSKKEDNEYRVN